jgi:hypothetical protein
VAVKPSLPVRIATWFIALLVGSVYGLAGTIAHSAELGWFPIGLVLAIVGSGALLVAVRALTQDRWAALAAGLGMMASVLFFSGRGPGGSIMVPDDGRSLIWTISVPILVALVVLWPDRIRRRRAEA